MVFVLGLSPDEVKRLREQVRTNENVARRFKNLHAISVRDAAIISLLLLGVKAAEIVELKRSDLSTGRATLVVYPRHGKRRNSEMDAEARKWLTLYLEERDDQSVLLFISQRGGLLTIRAIERMLNKFGDQVGFRVTSSLLVNSKGRG